MQELKSSFISNFIDDNRWRYITDGLKITLLVTVFAVLIGVVLGFLIAIVRTTHDKTGKLKILNAICKVYLTVIRGTPMMVQLLIMYYVVFAVHDPGKMITAIIAFGLNSAAYVAEIVRSGIHAIDPGQREAAKALGMPWHLEMLRIVAPQATKICILPLVNQFIATIKNTSILSAITLTELTREGTLIAYNSFHYFEPYIAVAVLYLILTTIFTQIAGVLERRMA